MIKSASTINNLLLLRNIYAKEFSSNGIFGKRNKATALNIVERLEETKSNVDKTNPQSLTEKSNNTVNVSNTLRSLSDIERLETPSVSEASTLIESEDENRSRYGHTGKMLQEKIASESKLNNGPLLNLMFANRKLSFYDTYGPNFKEPKRAFNTKSGLKGPCKIMSESSANLLEDFIKSDANSKKVEDNLEKDDLKKDLLANIEENRQEVKDNEVIQLVQVELEEGRTCENLQRCEQMVDDKILMQFLENDVEDLKCEEKIQKKEVNQEKLGTSPEENQLGKKFDCYYSEEPIFEEDVIREMLAGISRVKQKGTFVKIISQYISHREQEQKNAEDVLFDMFFNEETGLISMGKFLASLKTTGIRKTDPRIRELMDNLKKVHKLNNYESGSSPETQHLNRETFKAVVGQNIVLIAKAFRQQFIIPDFAGFTKDIEDIYWKCKSNAAGKVADYIPQLARYSPDSWGVSICTIDGQRFSIGDVEVPFTLQSCSKPLTYAVALEKLGPDVVHSYIGQEPSGRNFNELVLDYNKKPHNPMINAGAILTCALLQTLVKPEMTFAEKFDYTMSWFKRMSGGETIGFNNAVFLSEREAADRNYALGFYMRENKCYPKRTNLKEVMDFYFQCCSMETTCEAMSVAAATLANGGICPTTEEKVFRPEVVRDVLSIMHSCGTYDYSGQFAFKVGLPAKSGVSGGMLLVIPNVMGIFTWSPPLDQLGNPVRGVQFCEELVNVFNFHRFDNLKHASNKKDPRKHRYETKGLSIVNLLFSAASGDVTALRRHRLSGMDLTLADYDGRTALHLAASEGHLECVKFLLEHCRVPHNPKDRWGNKPIDEATNFGHQSVVDYLTAYAENACALEAAPNTEAITSTTQADEEIKPVGVNEYDRSEAASPVPNSSGRLASNDHTKPGL